MKRNTEDIESGSIPRERAIGAEGGERKHGTLSDKLPPADKDALSQPYHKPYQQCQHPCSASSQLVSACATCSPFKLLVGACAGAGMCDV